MSAFQPEKSLVRTLALSQWSRTRCAGASTPRYNLIDGPLPLNRLYVILCPAFYRCKISWAGEKDRGDSDSCRGCGNHDMDG